MPVPVYDYTVVQIYYRELLPLLMKKEFTRDSEVRRLLLFAPQGRCVPHVLMSLH